MRRSDMPGPAAGAGSGPASPPVHIQVVLTTDPGGRPAGVVESDDGRSVAFVGWLELMAELARSLADASHPSAAR